MAQPRPYQTPDEDSSGAGPLRDAGNPGGATVPGDSGGPVGADTLDDLRGYEPSSVPDLTGTGNGPLG